MRLIILLLTVAMLAALLACGPIAEGEDQDRGPAPTATPSSEEEPTATSEPAPTEESKDESSDGESEDEAPDLTPTRDPGDPAGPPITPKPTQAPAKPNPPVEPRRDTPHPDGIAGCKSLNMFTIGLEELSYLGWCSTAVTQDVKTNCSSEDGTEAQLACARDRMSDAQIHLFRDILPCLAMTNKDESYQCYAAATSQMTNSHTELWKARDAIVQRVDSDDKVKESKKQAGQCMVDQGYTQPSPDDPFPWQVYQEVPKDVKIDRTATEEEQLAAKLARKQALNQCALDTGVYDAQRERWITEFHRLKQDNPEQAQVLLDYGLKEALEAEDQSLFLQLRYR